MSALIIFRKTYRDSYLKMSNDLSKKIVSFSFDPVGDGGDGPDLDRPNCVIVGVKKCGTQFLKFVMSQHRDIVFNWGEVMLRHTDIFLILKLGIQTKSLLGPFL